MRISTTTLESYRLWTTGDWMEEEELIQTIKGVFTPSPKMLLGQAFGRAIEKADKYRRSDSQGEYYAVPINCGGHWNEYIFRADTLDPCLLHFDRNGVFEVKGTKEYGGVTVVAKADQILGTEIIENKTKLSAFDFERYADSYQWRFMLDIFQASKVRYNVFCLDGFDEVTTEGEWDDGRDIYLKGIEAFNLYPYADLHDDCCELLAKFLGYVAARHLEEFLQGKTYA